MIDLLTIATFVYLAVLFLLGMVEMGTASAPSPCLWRGLWIGAALVVFDMFASLVL